MARLSSEKRAELEGFWRSHHDEWERSSLNQREYCELHALPLKRFDTQCPSVQKGLHWPTYPTE